MAIGIISLGGGGECDTYLTLGGNVIDRLYPLTPVDDPAMTGRYSDVVFYYSTFLLMFVIRFIIVIPITNFILSSDKDDYSDYV